MPDTLNRILKAWERGRGALLYGPPGTGKTRILSELFDLLRQPEDHEDEGILLDDADVDEPLTRPELDLPIPTPAKIVWVTFHQSFTYEDWILGLHPRVEAGGVELTPRMGILLDGIYDLIKEQPEYLSLVVLVDELNRGNAARIFGEFLTFLDADYRDVDAAGVQNQRRLPLPLRQIGYGDGETETVLRPTGEEVRLPWPLYFPRHVYFAGTMNSVDRAAIPIDSALARRFERIELMPDLERLSQFFDLGWDDLTQTAEAVRSDANEEWNNLTAYETAVLLLDRLNAFIGAELGPEFELGHGLIMPIKSDEEEDRWYSLARIWDDVIYPQVEDRFAGRPEELMALLKVDEPPAEEYAWKPRKGLGDIDYGRALAPVALVDEDSEVRRRSLRWLCI